MVSATRPLSAESEALLLERVRSAPGAERERAFAQLFEQLRRPIFTLCLHMIGSRAEAEEAMQDTFVSVYQALPAFRGESRVLTWVYRIAARTALRVKARRPPHATERGVVRLTARGPDPLQALEQARVHEALLQLPAEQTLVLSLFVAEGLSHADIAAVLGVPEGTVWSRLHHARKRLAHALEGAQPKARPKGDSS